jgi:hypothetical protein
VLRRLVVIDYHPSISEPTDTERGRMGGNTSQWTRNMSHSAL